MKQLDNRIQVIGICGAARAGKDTAARALLDHIVDYSDRVEFDAGYVVGVESYAAPIKSMIAMLLDFFDKGAIMQPETLQPFIDGDRKEELIPEIGMSTRQLMQTLGTEWGRNTVNENIWLNSMTARLGKYTEMVDHGYKGAFVLIPDVRFENEAKILKELGATILKIDRAGIGIGEVAQHESEAGIPDKYIDYVAFNQDTIEDLRKNTVSMLSNILPWAKDYTQILDDLEEDDTDVDEEQPVAST